MKLKDTSYDLFLKKNYFTKESKIPLHVRYDFGYIVVAKYQNQNSGKFIDTKTVAREAVKKFKEGKVKELNKTKNWSNSVKRKNLISEQQRNDLLIKIDDLRKKLASDENDSLLAYKKIISDLNLAKRSNYKFNQMLEKEFSEYNKTIKDLNSFIEKNEVFVHATSLFLNEGKKYLNKNKKALNEIYSKTLIKSFYENIEICLSWCKNPVFLIQKEQLDELEIVKADFEDFKTKLIAYELQEKENLLEAERKSNENITGFLETNQERKKREDKLLNEFQNFKKLIEQCKTIQLIPEINLLNTLEWEETNIKLNTLDELTIEEYQIDKIKCNNSINELLTGLEEVKTRVLKPYEQIKKFLNSQHEKLLIIKGMAGTGKTECINKIIQYYWQKKPGDYKGNLSKNIIVCSPTTVGAANIRQKGFFNAQTLDYFLNKWETDHQLELFIVDEASMLTKNQLSRIKNKFHTNNSTKFVFIGDEGQFRPYDFNEGAESESYALNLNYS